jgi:gamma-glutamyl-gamma-aminobutyrate hydrolase PuuD
LATKRILIPGGAANFSTSGGFGDAARQLYNGGILKNIQGTYFPIWGTCRGFELLAYLATGSKDILTDCAAENVALPLELKPGNSQQQHSYLFRYTNHQNATDIQKTGNVSIP